MNDETHVSPADLKDDGDLLDFDQIFGTPRELESRFAGQVVRFRYIPSNYDNAMQAQVLRVVRLNDGHPEKDKINDLVLSKLLVWWNQGHRNEAGKMVRTPITLETVAKLPSPLKVAMVTALNKDMGLGEEPSPAPENGSTAPGAASNGTTNGVVHSLETPTAATPGPDSTASSGQDS